MNKDWTELDRHYQLLTKNANLELRSPHHEHAAHQAVLDCCQYLDIKSVVELGCGTAPMLDQFKKMGIKTCGVTLLNEPIKHKVIRKDMHFSGLPDKSYDLVAARHSLEHSPMPLLLLMEMRRIAKKYALIILPSHTPRMQTTWVDHYSVFDQIMWEKLFTVAGWEIVSFKQAPYLEYEAEKFDEEYRWLLKKAT